MKYDADAIVAEAIKILYGQLQELPVLNNAPKVADYLRLQYGRLEYEKFGVLALDNKLHLIKDIPLFRGTTDSSPVYFKELFRELLLSGPIYGFIAYHNHPGGDTNPSTQDETTTIRLKEAARLLDFKMLDHIIISKTGYYSFNENGHKALF